MKHFYKLLSSNYRANTRDGKSFTRWSYPVWAESPDDPNFIWAKRILKDVFDYDLSF